MSIMRKLHLSSARRARSAAFRAIAFLAAWLILTGADPAGLPAGTVAVVAATWTSLKLLPANGWRLSPIALGRLVLRLLVKSVVAGADVAWRALDPRLPLHPGLVIYPVRLPPGAARNTFCTLSSLLPGTLPTGSDDEGALVVHCLDVGEPIVVQLSEEEALLMQTLKTNAGHG